MKISINKDFLLPHAITKCLSWHWWFCKEMLTSIKTLHCINGSYLVEKGSLKNGLRTLHWMVQLITYSYEPVLLHFLSSWLCRYKTTIISLVRKIYLGVVCNANLNFKLRWDLFYVFYSIQWSEFFLGTRYTHINSKCYVVMTFTSCESFSHFSLTFVNDREVKWMAEMK